MSPDLTLSVVLYLAGIVTGAGAAIAVLLHRLRRLWSIT